MKTVLEQLMELKDKISAIEIAVCGETICSDGACGCGCDEPPVEVVDEGPEFDSAGFSIEDREPEPKIEFTREQLLTFATKLAERVIDKCKEAVTDTNIDADNVVDLSMGYSYQIEVELDTDTIVRSIHDEIDGTIELDVDSVEDEVKDIMDEMDMIQKN